MLARREISIKIGKKYYIFSERDREDRSILRQQEHIRKKRVHFIQENVLDKDNQLAMLMAEMNKFYSPAEIAATILSDKEDMYLTCFDSFKVKNPGTDLEQFKQMLPEDDLDRVIELVMRLEAEEETGNKKKAVTRSRKK